MSKHTKGKLEVFDQGPTAFHLLISKRGTVAMVDSPRISEAIGTRKVNAERLAACWNALEGLNPEAIPDMVREFIGVRDGINELTAEIYSMTISLRTAAEIESSLKRLERISDAALRKAGVIE